MHDTSPRVLIIRLDAIGDALALTPLLAALAERAIPVDLVMRAQNAGIFSARAVRRVYTAPFDLRSDGRENRAAIEAFGASLQTQRYTHVLVPTEDASGYRLARATRAPNRIGFVNGWGKPLKTMWAMTQLTRTVHRSAGLDRHAPHECAVLFELGRTLVGDAMPTRDVARLRPIVLDAEPAADPRVVLQISDKWERLGISFDEVVHLLELLRERGPLRCIAAGTERAYSERVRAATGVAIETFDDLGPWKAAIAGARALVAPDSGALHVAGMTGTPTVAVFPPIAEFALQAARWAPWAAPSRVVKAERGWPSAAVAALVDLNAAVAANELIDAAFDEPR